MIKPEIIDAGVKNGKQFVALRGVGNFSVFKTFDCGQCFRFDPSSDLQNGYEVSGVAFGRHVSFKQENNKVIISGATEKEYHDTWERYLSLDSDYDEIDNMITHALDEAGNSVMARAADVSRGIRLLRQDSWEALCSFIISQNNNIPRIKKIISALCVKFGEKLSDGEYAFPTAEALAAAGEDEIFALKTGFRASYIVDAARKVSSGEIDLNKVKNEASFDKCMEELMKIRGVGPKVASCALLFGFDKTEAYPIDTWMKKVAARHFESGPDPTKFGKYAGIAQQYLFYMERYINGGK
ncbi:MAG: DNA-3-methyladenine glycosylase 2 family protein [Clostridiales bacterium]|nr:DNA-3-methyladenine glycosylase 2 family protein [Clostridiales bacterium]